MIIKGLPKHSEEPTDWTRPRSHSQLVPASPHLAEAPQFRNLRGPDAQKGASCAPRYMETPPLACSKLCMGHVGTIEVC